MHVLTLDFETRDPSIGTGRGAGWVFEDFEVLGAAYKIDGAVPVFTTNKSEIAYVVRNARSIICHNAQYDIGCLHRLGINYLHCTIIDTVILAKLHDNGLFQYGLDSLSLDILGERKDYLALEEALPGLTAKKALQNISLVMEARPDLVARYAKQDVELTYRLSQWYKKELYEQAIGLIPMYSDLIKSLVISRAKGVRIDSDQAERSSVALQALEDEARQMFSSFCGDINIESTKQLAEAFERLGLAIGVSEKGGPSVAAKWRSSQTHPAILALSDAKKYQKLRRDFVEGVLSRAENGRLHPEINILGAVETGRFSGSNPNIQQLPKRDEVANSLVRSIFLPEEGCNWASLDFSAQEPRIQVAYAYRAGCPGAEELRNAYLDNVQLDMHQKVADMVGIDRKVAKTINLGISYGMGAAKLAATLKVSEEEAAQLKKKYSKLAPYLTKLNSKVREVGLERGYITTLLGRRLSVSAEAPYKALNKLIQGSAADQTTLCLVKAYREGLPVMFSIHDSIEMSISDPSQATRMKEIMEQPCGLPVPFYTDILTGRTWGDC